MKRTLQDTFVLVVEDEMMLNKAYVTILQAEGVDVESCFNGEEALEKIQVRIPDIILLDLRMPKMDGIAFLKKFSERSNAPDTKIIIFSNYDDQAEIDEAFSLGANRYILKAWASPKELAKLIRETAELS